MKNNELNAVKEHWEDVKTVSLKDNNLQFLERRTILDFIERTKKNTLKDIGCGDGSDTIFFAEKFNKVFAYDYSSTMLEKASKVLSDAENISLSNLDIIEDQLDQKSDVVITKRMLINLGSFQNQKNAIKKIYDSLEDDGYLIMLETSVDGLEKLNYYRKKFDLHDIPKPFHNTLFVLDELKFFVEEFFIIEDISFFSTYYFLTRIYNPLLNESNYMEYDEKAKNIAIQNLNLFSSQEIIGPQFCMLLKKKSSYD